MTVPVAADGVTVAMNVKTAPYGEGFAEEVNATEDACKTAWVKVAEVLVLSFESPP